MQKFLLPALVLVILSNFVALINSQPYERSVRPKRSSVCKNFISYFPIILLLSIVFKQVKTEEAVNDKVCPQQSWKTEIEAVI